MIQDGTGFVWAAYIVTYGLFVLYGAGLWRTYRALQREAAQQGIGEPNGTKESM